MLIHFKKSYDWIIFFIRTNQNDTKESMYKCVLNQMYSYFNSTLCQYFIFSHILSKFLTQNVAVISSVIHNWVEIWT